MKFKIVTDTTCNLTRDYLEKNSIVSLPLMWHVNGEQHEVANISDINTREFYDLLRSKAEVKTSLVNSQVYIDAFEPLLAGGSDIMVITIASGISGTYQACVNAVKAMREKYPERRINAVDSCTAGLGEGLVVRYAISLRDSGMDLDSATADIENAKYRIHSEFTVNDLMYLKRGGRLSGVAATVGTVLQLKPMLRASTKCDISLHEKVRGRQASLEKLAELFFKYCVNPEKQVIAINHGDCIEDAKNLISMITKKVKPIDILVECFEPAGAAHVGPGAMALFYMGIDRRTSPEFA